MQHVNIISVDNGAGLSRSIRILSDILGHAGMRVTVSLTRAPSPLGGLTRALSALPRPLAFRLGQLARSAHAWRRRRFDLNIFVEIIRPGWFPFARANCLIPNQEWFEDRWRRLLPQFDLVLCKTKAAQRIFSDLGCPTEYISFTSPDRLNESCARDYGLPFHLAGQSQQKGTKTVIELWLRHPEWPQLAIVQNPASAQQTTASNINHILAYLDDEALRRYQNTHGIHLCPSEAEGFGHCIVEAMSCKAVAIVTNAPPMNEIAAPERAVLVEYATCKPQNLGVNYHVDPRALERRIDEVLGMDEAAKRQMGERARAWYLENDRFFRKRLVRVVTGI